jgi:ComF family protein
MEKKHFTMARAYGMFRGSLMDAIHRFKYGKKYALSSSLSALVRDTFFRYWNPARVDLLIPVPLHIKRLRARGFNQAYLLVHGWAKENGVPYDGFLLRRQRWTEPQSTMSREERKENVKGAFEIVTPERVLDKRIVLVDDVYTTGFTANECARVLMNAGACRVDVLTLARALL